MGKYDDDYLYLLEKLDLYGLGIAGKTKDQGNNRGEGIINYLKAHPEIVSTSEDYGNGRYVRKRLEEAEMNLAERCFKYDVSDITDEILTNIEAEDIPEAKLNNVSSKIHIGFAC